MKFLANEDIPLESVNILKEAGFDVKHLIKRLAGVTDQRVVEIAKKEKRTFITCDIDLCNFIYKSKEILPAGVIAFHQSGFTDQYVAKMIVKMSSAMKITFEKSFIVVKDNFIKQRKY